MKKEGKKMRNGLFRKTVILGIIILLIWTSIIPVLSDEPSIDEQNIVKEKLEKWLSDHPAGTHGFSFDITADDYAFVEKNVWAVGYYHSSISNGYGRILYSPDFGDTWEVQWKSDEFGPAPFRVIFLDKKEGFVGTDDSVLHTIDGGKNWVAIWKRSGFDNRLTGFEVIDKYNLFYKDSRKNQFYLYSTDEGRTRMTKSADLLKRPIPPVLISPGINSEPGQEINTLTPTFQWNSVEGADYYALYIKRYPYSQFNPTFDSEEDYGFIYGTSLTLPDGILKDGQKYRWDVRAHNIVDWSMSSDKLYFSVNIAPDEEETEIPTAIKVLMDNGEIQEMDLDEYLKGVVCAEMGPEWVTSTFGLTKEQTLEALKSQAIASRSYACAKILGIVTKCRNCIGTEADVCTLSCCQRWKDETHSLSDKAIADTSKVVITYNGKIIKAFYSAFCGGETIKYGDEDYLQSVVCCCKDTWGSQEQLEKDSHGWGMCQWGTVAMAKQGYNYEEILKHYYTSIELTSFNKSDDKSETPSDVKDNGTPGFELIVFLCAVTLIFLGKHRQNKK